MFADVDADNLYDLSSSRPWVSLDDNGDIPLHGRIALKSSSVPQNRPDPAP